MKHVSTRICHLTLSHTPFDVRVFEKECRSLASVGYDVHLAVPGAVEGEVHNGVTMHDIAHNGVSAGPGNGLSRWRNRLAQTLTVARGIDARIYHLHDPELIPVGLALARAGKTIIYDAHEDAPLEAWSINRDRPFHRVGLTALWWALLTQAKRTFNLFVAATPEIARKFPRERTIEVRNYPRLEMFPAPTAETTAPRDRSLVFAGLVSRTRGAIEMLDALAAVSSPDVRLKLFGTIASDELKREMQAHPGWARVDYVGHRPWREVIEAYARSSGGLLLYDSTPEQLHCMPVKLFEFLLAGVPVIASDILFWRELLDGNPAVRFVDMTNPTVVAAEIERLVGNPTLIAQLGMAGHAHACQRFSWDAEGVRLVDGYARLLAP